MLALLAAAVIAQSSVSIQIGKEARDSASKAKRDSIAVVREQRRDSLRAREHVRDSVRRQSRLAKKLPLTPAVLATAFKDPAARELLLRARAARLSQDTSLTGYIANGYERMSIGMGFKRIGRNRLLLRSERASRVTWQRGKGAIVDVKGARTAMPILDGIDHDADGDMGMDEMDIPYLPGRETLWIGSGMAKADVSDDEIIHPLASGAEAYYTYESGDSVGFQLPGGQKIELRELRIRPRQPKWNVAVGSLWFDASTAQLVRAVYRMAQEMDIMAVAKEEDDEDPEDDIPGWVKPMILPMRANVSAITVEYGLHEGRFWLPRSQTIEAEAQVSFMHVPFRLEQHYTYDAVNGSEPMVELTVAALDTATDSVSRAARRARHESECKEGTERVRTRTSHEDNLVVLMRVPCDTAALTHSSELPKSIYDEGEQVFGSAERDALVSEALTLGAQPGFNPQPPVVRWGLAYTRFNRVEGVSSAVGVDQVLGGGYSAHALFRLGVADLSPNGELSLDRTNGRSTVGVGVYRRLVAANDWGDPLGFSSSLSALLFGRDEGFYYRTWGAELAGRKTYGLIHDWRLFAEQEFDAAVHTEFAIAHPGGVKGDLTNIDAVNGNVVGLAVAHHSSIGLDPHGFRALTDLKLEGAAGTFDYSRGLIQTTMSHGIGGLDAALTLGGGTSGGHVPLQKQFFLGGVQTVRGQRAGAAIGDSFWMSSLEIGSRSIGFRKIVFGDLGWAGSRDDFAHPGRPLSGAGVGASFMDGLVRLDLAKGIYPEKSFRANLYVEARF